MTTNALRGIWRALAVVLHIGGGLTLATILRIGCGRDWQRAAIGTRTVRWWMGTLCRIIGLHLDYRGAPLAGAQLIVANHVSWLDVVAIAALQPTLFVAKSEVRSWPVLGALATLCGTVFVRRRRLAEISRTVDRLTELLLDGQTVTLFPEASTSEGDSVGTFHGALFQAAIGAEVPVQTIAIRYLQGGVLDRRAAFVNDDTFVLHLLRVLARPSTTVELSYCQPQHPPHPPRRLLAVHSRKFIFDSLVERPSVPAPTAAAVAGGTSLSKPG